MTGTKVPKVASVSTRLVPMNVSDISFFTCGFHPLQLIRNDWEGQFFGWRFVATLLPYLIFDLLKTNINIFLELVLAQVWFLLAGPSFETSTFRSQHYHLSIKCLSNKTSSGDYSSNASRVSKSIPEEIIVKGALRHRCVSRLPRVTHSK